MVRVRFSIFALAALLAAAPTMGKSTAAWSEQRVVQGDPIVLAVTSDSQEDPKLLGALPDFLQYQGAGSSTQIYNGRVTSTVSFRFAVNAPAGEAVIPSVQVRVGSDTVTVPECKLVVSSPEIVVNRPSGTGTAKEGKEKDLDQLIFGAAQRMDNDRTEYYVGEEIPLELQLFVAESVTAQPAGYPTLDAGKAFVHHFDGSEDPNFQFRGQARRTVDGDSYTCWRFFTAFRSLAPGRVRPKAEIPVTVLTTGRRMRDVTVDFPLPEFTIKPLPPVPQGMIYLGLVGDWQLTVTASGSPLQAGEALTLSVDIVGDGAATLETLTKPVLDWPGCRVFPPELVTLDAQHAQLKYTFVPCEAGKLSLPVKFACFDPVAGSYRGVGLGKALEIAPAPSGSGVGAATAPAVVPPGTEAAASADGGAPSTHAGNLYYLKLSEQPGGAGFGILLALLLFVAGPAWAGCLWLRRRVLARRNPASVRRAAALARRRTVLREIARDPVDFPAVMRSAVLPYLADLRNLPPGVSAAEAAERIESEDVALAAALREYEIHAYAPAGQVDWRKTAAAIAAGLKHLGVWLVAACCLTAVALHGEDGWSDAVAAYDAADFAKAAAGFEQLLGRSPDDAALWYDLGCCEAQQQNWAKASWCFEGAELLAPGDTATRENLNAARRKLLLPEYGRAGSPQAFLVYLRDLSRPHVYLVLLAAGWCALWIWWSYRRRWSFNMRWTVTGVIVFAMALALAAYLTQRWSRYAGDRGIIVVKNASLYSLPSQVNAREIGTLRGGTPVRLEETRQGFVHVDAADADGWVKSDAVGKLP